MNTNTKASEYLPFKDEIFTEHVRIELTQKEEKKIKKVFHSNSNKLKQSKYSELVEGSITSILEKNKEVWIGTTRGLYFYNSISGKLTKHGSYGIDGPLSTHISAIAMDSKGKIWIGTPLGLNSVSPDGSWTSIQGRDGLPVEEITALAIDKKDRIWIGTSQGAILYTPYEEGRQWYYRAGKRYLINDHISDIEIAEAGMPVFFNTKDGLSKIEDVERTLREKADIIEGRIDKWHRRMGLVAECTLDDAETPTSSTIQDGDNDGLWTSYHVGAMSLAYASTGDIAYLKSAKESMDAMIMLQNVSGTPGVLARSVVPIELRSQKSEQWRETPDGKFLWKSDASSDEVNGHFFAFYTYWEHIAKHDPKEAALIKEQVRTLMNFIVDNNYQLLDWDGERTKWGFWNPENLNDKPEHYLETGLYSAQILSFLKVSWYITGDKKFKKHYDYLITEHGYLGNLLLEKKIFPDSDNHSDNQLGFVALYPLLQLEFDPRAREALQRTVRRHYQILSKDNSSFYYLVAATIDPDYVDIKSGVEELRQIPTDRRQWGMINSNRKDVVWSPHEDRFKRRQLLHVLPADERNFGKWFVPPNYPDGGGDGKSEDDGSHWLLPYWIGRYHGFIDGEK